MGVSARIVIYSTMACACFTYTHSHTMEYGDWTITRLSAAHAFQAQRGPFDVRRVRVHRTQYQL